MNGSMGTGAAFNAGLFRSLSKRRKRWEKVVRIDSVPRSVIGEVHVGSIFEGKKQDSSDGESRGLREWWTAEFHAFHNSPRGRGNKKKKSSMQDR